MAENNKTDATKLYKLAKLYMGTSDDLLFWVLIDTMFLCVVKGLTATQISLTFTISLWVALASKYPLFKVIKKLDVADSILVGSVMMLVSSILLTVCRTMVGITAGQCLYVMAPSFISMGDVLLKDVCKKAEPREDYVQAKISSCILCAIITLIAAVAVNPLMKINSYLPMFLCIASRVFALFLSLRIKHYKFNVSKYSGPIIKRVTDKIPRSNFSFFVMAAMLGIFFAIANSNLKLLLTNDLINAFPNDKAMRIFSYFIIGTRVAKLAGNYLLKLVRNKSKNYEIIASTFIVLLALVPLIDIASCDSTGKTAIVLAGSALILYNLLFDIFQVLRTQLMIDRLNEMQTISVIFMNDMIVSIARAGVSSIITLLIAKGDYKGVMIIFVILIFLAIIACYNGYKWKKERRNRYESVWDDLVIKNTDSLIVATRILMSQYGLLRSFAINPETLSKLIAGNIEQIDKIGTKMKYGGRMEFEHSLLVEKYDDGCPCAILADDGEGQRWYPVLYTDEETAIVYNCYNDIIFAKDFNEVSEICYFTIKKREKK